MKIVAIFLVVFGCILFGVGMSMRTKQNIIKTTSNETIYHDKVVKGSKKNAAIGAGTGAAVGVGVGATIGGVGIALCGTGVGIPVGVVCLALGGVGALLGGGVGLAASTPDKVVKVPETIERTTTQVVSAYSPAEYWSIILIGMTIVAIGMYLWFWKRQNDAVQNNSTIPGN